MDVREASSEAVARAARERSEQERELHRYDARGFTYSRGLCGPVASGVVRLGRAWFAAPLLAVALLVVAVGSASAADEGDAPLVVSADQSGSLGVVSTAQSDGQTDPESDADRRLVGRESSERVDAIVIALWSIAAGMTVMLGIFLWHTSPRRRLRLARRRSTELYETEGESEDSAEAGSAEERGEDSGEEGEELEEPEVPAGEVEGSEVSAGDEPEESEVLVEGIEGSEVSAEDEPEERSV